MQSMTNPIETWKMGLGVLLQTFVVVVVLHAVSRELWDEKGQSAVLPRVFPIPPSANSPLG